MITEIVFAGFGGQGVLTAGRIVGEMALKDGKHVSWMPAYGPKMRGGKANSVVKFSDEPLGNPNMEEIDVLVAMNQPSTEFAVFLKRGGDLFINSDASIDVNDIRERAAIVEIPCMSLAKRVDNLKGAALVMVGAVLRKHAFFEVDFACTVVKDFFSKKGKEESNDANINALVAGFEYEAKGLNL